MSTEHDKFVNSKRRHDDETKIKRQVKIAKQHGLGFNDEVIKKPHRLVKRHAMDCGKPNCFLCGNPRKTHKDKLTQQEKRLFQDIDFPNPHRNNGLPPKETK